MIDSSKRPQPRFPAGKEAAAREAIRQLLLSEKEAHPATVQLKGIAGGACGGDILFHELCLELEIPSEIYLTLIPEEFKETSVAFAGMQWIERFEQLIKTSPIHLLPQKYILEQPDIWEATNNWMLEKALNNGPHHMSLIALWDGRKGDGKGGTAHMVKVAGDMGITTRIAYTGKLQAV